VRILVVARSTVGHRGSGGMEQNAHRVVQHLRAEGHRLGLVTTAGVDVGALDDVFEAVWVAGRTRPGRYSLRWWLSPEVTLAVREHRPDLVLSISTAASSLLVRRGARPPVVLQMHGTARAEIASSLATPSLRELAKVGMNAARTLRERLALRRADTVVAVSDEVSRQLRAFPYGVAAEVIPNGVAGSVFRDAAARRADVRGALGIAPDASLGAFVGRLHPQKGADLAVAALSALPAHHQLLVVGDGPAAEALAEQARASGVAGRVHLLGRRGQDELPGLLAASDVFVFPTRRREGLPLTLLEAAAAGLPIVTTAGCGVPPDLGASVTLCRPDAEAVARAWRAALDGPTGGLAERYEERTMLAAYAALVERVGA
jgi:glycosyltransferase involved in cell wall biosynthesis